jgi:hypothetical protein
MTDEEKTIDTNETIGKTDKPEIQISIKQPKVQKVEKEKKELSEKQLIAIQKMRDARQKKRDEQLQIKKDNEELERKQREDAVSKAEAEAKKITDNVKVDKVRGRKIGTKKQQTRLERIVPEPVEEQQMSYNDYVIQSLRNRGINVPDNPSPYLLKMLMSRFR